MNAVRKPLNPEPDPQTEAALAASMERLRKRCEEVQSKAPTVSGETIDRVAPANASAEVRQAPPSLEWLERLRGTNFQKSRCGQYTVSAARVNGQWRFSAYYGPSPSKVLGQAQDSAEAARAIAEAHARSWK